jgi:hypothetical protein
MPKETRHAYADQPPLDLPERVTATLASWRAPARGLLALAVATGLQVMQTLMDEDVARLVGPRGGNLCTTVSLQQKFVVLSLRSVPETGSR